MERSGAEWNRDSIPLFGYFMKGTIMFPFHCLESGRNKTNYDFFIPFYPYLKTLLLLSKTYFYYYFFLETKHIHIGFSFPNQEENKLMKLILDIQEKDAISSTKHVPQKKIIHLLNIPLKTVQLLNKFGIKFQCNVST